ncbi:flagellar assembly protein A [Aquibacillus albus]|uniref:Uncharacterized protein (DUF342 family) n=1 Tax=Aquibacillus albus TaxID=1168171 RepID=A0ABS2N593_9BACI|nr:FapA family protein [Aquibacillus albus]MBM7573324.1 uncharacterized protein (DUF342 family) [Aquibacillus albus]
MQSIISKGKSVKEAVEMGLKLMKVNESDVNIEILQQETKGVMGIGRKTAIVKLFRQERFDSYTKSDHSDDDLYATMDKLIEASSLDQDQVPFVHHELHEDKQLKTNQLEELEGKAWVKNGKIFVKESATQFPLVKISENVQLIKNNQIVTNKKTVVSEADLLEIKWEEEQKKETNWQVTIDELKLKVMLEVEPGYRLTREIRDVEPNQQIELVADEYYEAINTLTYEDVINKMKELRVTYGFNQNEILKALEAKENNTYEIATGKQAKPGIDGWVELNIDVDPQNGLFEDESGKVDFREIKTIPTVDQGAIIATIHSPTPGQPGITVMNEPLPAKRTHPIIMKAEKGAMVVKDKVVATESGRPFVEKRGQLCKVSVIPKLVHQGNVNLSSGNIRFNGDVEIRGEVEENMVVEAGGDIVAFKSINHSNLITSKSIVTYGSVISSELSAGKNNMLIVEIGHLLGIIHAQVEKMIMLIKQLMVAPAFKSTDFSRTGLQPLINILLEKKFNGFRQYVRSYVKVTNKGKNYLEDECWLHVSASLSRIFLALSNQVISLEMIVKLSEKMKELHEFSKTPVEPEAFITISNTLNSSLYSSGNIIIIGKGSVNTKIHAGGLLKISGIVRGGELYGRLGVDINEVGSNSGTKTFIAVPSDQKIKMNKAMEGTVIKIGHITYVFQQTKYHVDAHLDSEGRMIFN